MSSTAYGDITPRTAAYAAKEMLERGIPHLVFERFGQTRPLPSKSSKVIKFRRYTALSATPNVLTEGVTPTAKKLTVDDRDGTLIQYGDLVTISDVIADTHEDPVFQEAQEVLGEQAATMIENVRFGLLKAGTSYEYANGAARDAVNTVLTTTVQRRVTRALKRQEAKKITRVVRSTPNYATQNVAPAFIAICHPDVESDIRGMTGFVAAENYGTITPYENEIGKVEDCRYLTSTILAPWEDGGGTKSTMESTSGSNADVYPVLYFARDAYGIVPLKGKNALTPSVINPTPSKSDPLGQRGHVSWKAMQTVVILNELWMVRAEVAVTA